MTPDSHTDLIKVIEKLAAQSNSRTSDERLYSLEKSDAELKSLNTRQDERNKDFERKISDASKIANKARSVADRTSGALDAEVRKTDGLKADLKAAEKSVGVFEGWKPRVDEKVAKIPDDEVIQGKIDKKINRLYGIAGLFGVGFAVLALFVALAQGGAFKPDPVAPAGVTAVEAEAGADVEGTAKDALIDGELSEGRAP